MDWHITQNNEFLSIMKDRLLKPKLIWVNQFVEIIDNYITDNNINYLKINDIGCNVGHFYRGIAKNTLINYIGYDISQTYINIAQAKFGNHFQILDISNTIPRQCDVSVISATLEHIEYYKKALFNIFNSTNQLIIMRTFIGETRKKEYHLKQNAKKHYLIRQFLIDDIINIPNKLGWTYNIIKDIATNSIPKKITNNIIRTQKVLIFKHE